MQPTEGTYLLTGTGFSLEEKPVLSLLKDGEFIDFNPLTTILTLSFDTSTHYCTGWRDITTGERHPCPDAHTLEGAYEQCQTCQNRTGFNPAFYHATNVSTQQEERNAKPHILYLAHFGAGITKVGISYADRKNSRLLEQGARSAIILETFPTAHIARQYEEKIARLPGIAETIQLRKKIDTLERPYDEAAAERELLQIRQQVTLTLGVDFKGHTVQHFSNIFFPGSVPKLQDAINLAKDVISGNCIGMMGSLLFCDYETTPVFLPLKKYIGTTVRLHYTTTELALPPRQASLF